MKYVKAIVYNAVINSMFISSVSTLFHEIQP